MRGDTVVVVVVVDMADISQRDADARAREFSTFVVIISHQRSRIALWNCDWLHFEIPVRSEYSFLMTRESRGK